MMGIMDGSSCKKLVVGLKAVDMEIFDWRYYWENLGASGTVVVRRCDMGGGGIGDFTLGYIAGIIGGCDVWMVAMTGGVIGGLVAVGTGIF